MADKRPIVYDCTEGVWTARSTALGVDLTGKGHTPEEARECLLSILRLMCETWRSAPIQ